LLTFLFKSCAWHAQCPCCSSRAQASDVIILDTPRGDLNELSSSSYGLSLFSSKAGSHAGEGVGAMPDGSSSVSIDELWPRIDQLDEVGPGSASEALVENQGEEQAQLSRASSGEIKVVYGGSHEGQDVPGSSTGLCHGCDRDSTKNKVTQILADAAGAVFPLDEMFFCR
jgi:hypothetical protein